MKRPGSLALALALALNCVGPSMLMLLAGCAAGLTTAATASNGNLGEIGYKRPHTTLLKEF